MAAQQNGADISQNAPPAPLFLDEWIRSDVIGLIPAEQCPALQTRALDTRRLIRYCAAKRLAETLEHVLAHSLHYARKFSAAPGTETIKQCIAELRDLAAACLREGPKASARLEERFLKIIGALPFTWPEELVKDPESFLAVSHSEVDGLISQSSSGTTGRLSGEFKRIFCTAGDQEKTIDFFAHGIRYLVDPSKGDSVALLLSAGGRGGGSLAYLFGEAMRRIGVPCLIPKNVDDEAFTLGELAGFGPTCLVGTPRQLFSLFRSSEASDQIARIKDSLKNILITGDRSSAEVNKILSGALEAEIFLHYGMLESGLGTAVECARRRGGHYRETDFFIEIITPDGVSHPLPQSLRETSYIDPDRLEAAPYYAPTPWGEVTITSLSRRGSPLVRYRTGDSGRINVNRCGCGSDLWRLEVRGRIGDYVKLPAPPGHLDTGSDSERQIIIHGGFDQALYALPWVKDHQVSIRTDENDRARALGLAVLVNDAAPQDEAKALSALAKTLMPIRARAAAHGVEVCICLRRDRAEFQKLFRYSAKRTFISGANPFDMVLYTRLSGA